jgi:hypothetical protein
MRIAIHVAAAVLMVATGCRGRSGAKDQEGKEGKEGKQMSAESTETEIPHSLMVARSLEELRIKTASFDRLFQIGQADWQLDQERGEITFTSPKGLMATAPAQIAGSYNTDDGTWLWAWDNPSVEPALMAHAKIVRQYGSKRKIEELTTRKLKITEEKAWELAALTCKLGNYQGVYRGPAGPTLVFITFGEVKLQKQR